MKEDTEFFFISDNNPRAGNEKTISVALGRQTSYISPMHAKQKMIACHIYHM